MGCTDCGRISDFVSKALLTYTNNTNLRCDAVRCGVSLESVIFRVDPFFLAHAESRRERRVAGKFQIIILRMLELDKELYR